MSFAFAVSIPLTLKHTLSTPAKLQLQVSVQANPKWYALARGRKRRRRERESQDSYLPLDFGLKGSARIPSPISSEENEKDELSGWDKLQAAIQGQSSRELITKATWASLAGLVLWFVIVHTVVVGDWIGK